jgi:hypothetical protein
MFHKAATPTASKAYTLDRARALMFLHEPGDAAHIGSCL